ncbi:gluconokinase [Alicyclobacillus fastidiosus]|uniref:Gluconokinase n=1 Tax=Alicyclobacillus fastidiosus TaxID=392011 RepID=A0ABY6ZIE6_9BACL|nr:gluconokinase [Alicyclobacillus fastidiosus]WAH41891.1 gluconokinase [Alicyclobacillus fastidiosus]
MKETQTKTKQLNHCIIGLDIGTTTAKAIAYQMDGTEITSDSELVTTRTGEDGSAVQEPEAVYESVTKVFSSVCRGVIERGLCIDAIGFSAAMHSLIPVDAEDQPLFPAMLWLDARPYREAAALWSSDTGKDIYHHTGTPIHAMAPVAKIAWFQSAYKDLAQRTARYVSIKEYVWHRWFGVWEVDHAVAAATGLFDGATFDWYAPALTYAGISAQQLSTIVPTSHIRSLDVTPFLGTSEASSHLVPVCIGGSDGVLATVAAGAMSGNQMILTMGTSLAIRTGHGKPTSNAEIRAFSYPLAPNQYVVGAPSNSGGVVLDWLYRNVLTEDGADFDERFPRLCEEAASLSSDDLFCIPYVSGERAPIWDESATASFIGLRRHHQQGHLMRAAIEGVLFNAYWIAHQLMDSLGTPNRLIVSGKLFQQKWVREWTANLFNLEIEAQAEMDGATLGAAMIASEAIGGQLQIRREVTHVTRPRADEHERLQKKFERFRRLCAVVLPESTMQSR